MFRCRDCHRQFNERSTGQLNRTQYPSDVIALVVFWRLRQRAALRAAGCTRLFEEKAPGGRWDRRNCIACSTISGLATWW
jgi:hypothetical protein